MLSTGTLLTLGMLSPPLSNCYFTLAPVVPRAVPTMVVGVAVVAFGFFDNSRDGVGFNTFVPAGALQRGQATNKSEDAAPLQHRRDANASAKGDKPQQHAVTVEHDDVAALTPREPPAHHGNAQEPGAGSSLGDKLSTKLMAQTGNWASQVSAYLPSGSLLTLQTVMPLILPAEAARFGSAERGLAIMWLALSCVLCAVLSWTDSGLVGGEPVYAFVYPGGRFPSGVSGIQAWHWKDGINAALGSATLLALGMLTPPFSAAFFADQQGSLAFRLVPAGVVGSALLLYKAFNFNSGRNGLGSNPAQHQQADSGSTDTETEGKEAA
ncbi:hypothetical protein ABPG75_007516 [Micractinium tetrahymenae]